MFAVDMGFACPLPSSCRSSDLVGLMKMGIATRAKWPNDGVWPANASILATPHEFLFRTLLLNTRTENQPAQ